MRISNWKNHRLIRPFIRNYSGMASSSAPAAGASVTRNRLLDGKLEDLNLTLRSDSAQRCVGTPARTVEPNVRERGRWNGPPPLAPCMALRCQRCSVSASIAWAVYRRELRCTAPTRRLIRVGGDARLAGRCSLRVFLLKYLGLLLKVWFWSNPR